MLPRRRDQPTSLALLYVDMETSLRVQLRRVVRKSRHGEYPVRAVQCQGTRRSAGRFSQTGRARATSCVGGMGKVGGCAALGTEMKQPRYRHQGTALALTEGNGPTPIDVNEG